MILFVVVLFAITLTFPLQCNAVSIPRYPDESVAAKMHKIPIDKKFANYANARRDKKFSHFSFSISIIFRRFTKSRRTNRLQFCLYWIFSVLINGTIWNGKSTFFLIFWTITRCHCQIMKAFQSQLFWILQYYSFSSNSFQPIEYSISQWDIKQR